MLPAWAMSLLGLAFDKLILPLIKKALAQLGYDLRLSAIEKSQQALAEGTIKGLQAKTSEEKDAALHQISTSWNG